jgi:heat-inducible transcriptional repressor
MDDRKRNILRATVSSYIESAEPISSKYILKRYGFDISPATIRNELKELENEGYIQQVHTSSGRIPTDKGYRRYVDSLMNIKSLDADKQKMILEHIGLIGKNVHDILSYMTILMSSLVNYITIVMTPEVYKESLKVVNLILLDLNKILIVFLDSVGMSKEFLLKINHKINQDDLNKISRLLTEKLKGKSYRDINDDLLGGLVSSLPEYKIIICKLFLEVKKIADYHNKQKKLVMGGVSKMLMQPEFQDMQLTQKVISTIEENKLLLSLLGEYVEDSQNKIIIGDENKIENLKDCSLVISPCREGDSIVGAIGLLGPKRMKYSKMVPMVQGISKLINEYIN